MYCINQIYSNKYKKVDFEVSNISSTLNVKIKVIIPGNFILPPNIFLVNIESNIGKFDNIQLYLDWTHYDECSYIGEFNININDSSILSKKNISGLKIYFKPTILINSDVWNSIKFNPNTNLDVQNEFIKFIYQQSTYQGDWNFWYSNLFDLANYFSNLNNKYYIKPHPYLSINGFENLNFQNWSPINKIFTNQENIKNSNIKNFYLEIHFQTENKTKTFKFDAENLKKLFNIEYDFETKNFIIVDAIKENKKITFPSKVNGKIFIWFQISNNEYYCSRNFNINQDFISNNGKYKVTLSSLKVPNER